LTNLGNESFSDALTCPRRYASSFDSSAALFAGKFDRLR
jgi:hypothetical protein